MNINKHRMNSLEEIKDKNNLPNFYSQHGEDYLLSKLFENKDKGFFVEIGCIDGKRFSNTLFFEEKGWKGLCIEPHKKYYDLLKKNRPNSIIVNVAAGEEDSNNVNFYANSRGSLSSLDSSKEQEFSENYGEYFTGFEVQKVKVLTLNTIFDQYNVKDIDFISLDIEGYEVQALKGLNFNKYKPKVLMIESDSIKHRVEIEKLIRPFGYNYITSLHQNLFYSLDVKDKHKISKKMFENISLLHTVHPVDKGEDEENIVNIKTKNRSKLIEIIKIVIRKIIS